MWEGLEYSRTLDSVCWVSNSGIRFECSIYFWSICNDMGTSYLNFTLHYKKIRMVNKRTPYNIDDFKSVKILSAFNAFGDVNVFILTHASFYLPGGLTPCDIIISFVYFWLSNDLLLDLQQTTECDDSVSISRGQYANTDLNTKERVNVLPKQYSFVEIWMKPCINRTKSCKNEYLYRITKLDVMQL